MDPQHPWKMPCDLLAADRAVDDVMRGRDVGQQRGYQARVDFVGNRSLGAELLAGQLLDA
jgi:hypothetical protein